MKRTEAESLGDVMRKAIEESANATRFDEVTAINLWPRIIGADIARKTDRPIVKNGVMTIRVFAAPLRQELNMMRSSIARAINAELGKDVISEVKFTG